VTLLIDGAAVETLEAPPYQFSIDAGTLVDGDHDIAVEAATAADSVTSATIAVRIGVAASSGGGLTSGILPIAAIGAIAVVVLLLVLVVLRRGRGPQRSPAAPEPPTEPPPGAALGGRERAPSRGLWSEGAPRKAPPAPQRVLGSLVITKGELAGQTFPVGGTPISIGTGHRCLIRVADEGDDISTEHARVWVREDHLVVHEMRRLTAFGPAGGRWEFLSPGETFSVGSNGFEFQLVDETAPAGAEPAPVEPQASAPAFAAPPAGAQPARATTHIPTVRPQHEGVPDASLAGTQTWPSEPEVPEFEPQPSNSPAAPVPQPAAAAEPPAPAVPNILRERPPQADQPPPAPAEGAPSPEVPNILRERPPAAPDATPAAQGEAPPAASQDVPNVLRDKPDEEPAPERRADQAPAQTGDEHAA